MATKKEARKSVIKAMIEKHSKMTGGEKGSPAPEKAEKE